MDELKEVVSTTLEKQGLLAKLRAELRAGVFLAIEDQDRKTGGGGLAAKSASPRLQALLQDEDGQLLVSVVAEFLSWADLKFTQKVFEPEVNLMPFMGREELAVNLAVEDNDEQPLLLSVIQSLRAGGTAASAPSTQKRKDPPPPAETGGSPAKAAAKPAQQMEEEVEEEQQAGEDTVAGEGLDAFHEDSGDFAEIDADSNGSDERMEDTQESLMDRSLGLSRELQGYGADEVGSSLDDSKLSTSGLSSGAPAAPAGSLPKATRLAPLGAPLAPLGPPSGLPGLKAPPGGLAPLSGGLGLKPLAPVGKGPGHAPDELKQELLSSGILTNSADSFDPPARSSDDDESIEVEDEDDVVADELGDTFELDDGVGKGASRLGMSLDVRDPGISASDKSGELDGVLSQGADLFETAEGTEMSTTLDGF